MNNKELMDIVSLIAKRYIEIKKDVSNTGKDNHELMASYISTLYIMALSDAEDDEGFANAQNLFKDSLCSIINSFMNGYEKFTEDVSEQAINIFLDEWNERRNQK